MEAVVGRQFLGRDEVVLAGVELGVPERAFDGLAVVGEDALNPFVVKKARTVDILVEHARGEVVGGGIDR